MPALLSRGGCLRAAAGALALGAAVNPAGAAGRSAIRFNHWGSEHGLSHNSVYSLAQDRRGFLWVGTVDGLNRFDGYEFRVWRSRPGDVGALRHHVIRALLVDREDTLWVGTDEGLDRFDWQREVFTPVVLRPGGAAAPRTVQVLLEDQVGRVWAGMDRGLFVRAGPGAPFAAVQLPGEMGRPPEILGLREDHQGRIWVLTYHPSGPARLVRLTATFEADRVIDILSGAGTAVGALGIDRRGRFWLDPQGPLERATEDAQTLSAPGGVEPRLFAFAEDGEEGAWLGTSDGLFRWTPTGRQEVALGSERATWLDRTVRALYRDRAGALWIGTYAGLYRYDPFAKPFVHWRHDRADSNSLSNDAVSAIVEDGAGALWVGTFGGGLNRIEPGSGAVRRFRHVAADPASLPSDVIWSLLEGSEGRLWIATEAGLGSLDRRTLQVRRHPLPYPADALGDWRRLTYLAAGAEGRLWIASHPGLYSFDPRSAATQHYEFGGEEAGPNRDNIDSILPEPDGSLWLGTARAGLIRFWPKTGQSRRYRLAVNGNAALPGEGIWTIHRDGLGRLWLGTGAGLSRFDPVREELRHFGIADGLPGSLVYGILEDATGRLWLGTNRGLATFDDRREPGQKFRVYDLADGIGSMEFNRHSTAVGRDGRFYFGGVRGLTEFVPDRIRDDPVPPPVVLTGIESSRREGLVRHRPEGLERLVLSHRDDALALTFAALHFASPERNQYAYRLEGFDADWVTAGTRRFARYTNLPAGSYVFRVRAANPDGLWSDRGVALPVVVTPPFWETWWFRAAAVAALAALAMAVYRYRVARLLELERLRLRIAGDLHDDLSSDLAAIAMVTDLLRRKPQLGDEERGQLRELRDKALRMVEAVRDTVWYVNPEHDSVPAMVRRMRRVAEELLGETPYSFEAEVSQQAGLAMGVRRPVFLVFKELVHNVVRHALAKSVKIEVRAAHGWLSLRVADDGVGFDPQAPAGGEGTHGLASIRRRAEQMGGRLEIESAPGRGTSVRLTVEMARTRDGATA